MIDKGGKKHLVTIFLFCAIIATIVVVAGKLLLDGLDWAVGNIQDTAVAEDFLGN